jgi:hypothetical protein
MLARPWLAAGGAAMGVFSGSGSAECAGREWADGGKASVRRA